jgi:uncharacterized protein YcbK (DUF882 family)
MKLEDWDHIEHFSPDEFRCPCCGRGSEEMDRNTVTDVDAAREDAGIPFVITSAYRCPDHNAEVGGVSSSAHVRGYAVDIACEGSRSRHKIVAALQRRGFNRFGIAGDFVHVDADKDPDKSANVMWVY